MDLSEPIRSAIPTLDGPVLRVLARTDDALTGLEVHRRARRGSADGIRRALQRLTRQGLVHAEAKGPSLLYRLNRRHLAAPAVEALAQLSVELRDKVTWQVRDWDPPAVHVSLFGSAARGDGDERSDIDLLIIRAEDVSSQEPAWVAQLTDLARAIRQWTGNQAQLLEFAVDEFEAASRRREPLLAELRREAITLHGPDVSRLLRSIRRPV